MSDIQGIRRNLETGWIQFLNLNYKKLSTKNFSGATPPSIFVGHIGYPRVKIGPLTPPLHGDTSLLDSPERWLGKSLEEIVNFRLSLVGGSFDMNIYDLSGKNIEILQDLAMSKKSVESELLFEKTPISRIDQKKLDIDTDPITFGFKAPLKNFKISSLSADRRLENAFYDTDQDAKETIIKLYHQGVEISKIIRIFSMGMLGIPKNRKLVPTRWSISSIDHTISINLIKGLQKFSKIESYNVYRYHHLGNYYVVILIPYDSWLFEMQEGWLNINGIVKMDGDYEDIRKPENKPNILGAFFAGRLASTEHLTKIKKKAAVMIFREILPQYVIPVGVWQVREGIRNAFKRQYKEFEDFEGALSFAFSLLSISKKEWLKNSKIYKSITKDKKILDYF
ncbi:MAG TPA: hypothetical protein VIY08_15160 [Candidatus Nitrosocosmicus sp.]